ncbi:phytase [Aestuariibacter sp. GS-14]|uniref:phytase n=1 Tax=Aestuariibacter sp. GS-14 TaxID=2590670 RepID=UPI00112C51E9|nr:phytase [Aestuariibacter sp. GS-14]TPV53894.1 phytase [Aestuariibacter sp. GS-14]
MKLALLTLTFGLLLTGCTVTAETPALVEQANPIVFNAVPVKGESLLPVANNVLEGWLVTSEQSGLTWLTPDFQSQHQWQGHISQADWRWLNNDTLLIAALDNNTTALHLLTLDTHTGQFTSQLQVPSDIADRETVCLQQSGEHYFLFSTDARGLLTHSLLQLSPSNWQIADVRTLMIGPNISSCSVADDTATLYLAEEEIGIWQYEADSEGENGRILDYFPNTPEIESVSALPDGRYFAVATSEPVIHQRSDNNTAWPVEAQWELKSIRVASTEQGLIAGIYDEASNTLFSLDLPGDPVTREVVSRTDMLTADAQTTPVNRYGDAADDPAFWINTQAPADSLILGTDKKFGLNVYSLDGTLQQSLPVGRVNNVDVRQGIASGHDMVDIAVASNRSSQSLSVFSINQQGSVALLDNLPTRLSDVYGLCTGVINNRLQVVVNDTDGRFEHYALTIENSHASAQLVSEFTLPSQPEGCVIDDATSTLYYGEESTGIWMRHLTTVGASPELIAGTNAQVHADIEGMDIYRFNNQRYLIVSSQGNSRFAVYALDDNHRLLGTFGIAINHVAGIDGVSETDGLAVTSHALGDDYPMGMLVVQDGRNVMPAAPQNFKILNGEKLVEFIQRHQ